MNEKEINFPTVGYTYIVKFDGVAQWAPYVFDQGDDGNGEGEYFWDRGDVDESPLFDPSTQEWMTAKDAFKLKSEIESMEANRPALVPKHIDLAGLYADTFLNGNQLKDLLIQLGHNAKLQEDLDKD